MKKVTTLLSLLFISIPFIYPPIVSAHSFGKLYSLPVPFWMYLFGSAAALLVSFLIIGFFHNQTKADISFPTYNLFQYKRLRFINKRWFINLLKAVSIFLFFFTLLTGFIGNVETVSIFSILFFWIIFILLFAYATALFGNIYETINPLKILVEVFESKSGIKATGLVKYPEKLGYTVGFVYYMVFILLELLGQTTALTLSMLINMYALQTFLGVAIVGKESWFKYVDFLSIFFRLLGKMSIFAYNSDSNTKEKATLLLRPPFIGLLAEKAENISLLLFILFMLSSTAYDGIQETYVLYVFYTAYFESYLNYSTFHLIGIILSPFFFLTIYIIFIYLTKVITKSKLSIKDLALRFAFTLVPIAFVYNVAHYYTLILTEGQNFIRVLSDPFGWGWNLFNTASYVPNLSVVDAGVTWHVQLALILFGHIVSVYLAHLTALQVFPTHRKALLSQIPMLILMVTFTVIGLWVLSQPINGGTL